MVPRFLFAAILFLALTTSWCSSEEDQPLKTTKNLFPKKFEPMEVKTFQEESTTTSNTDGTTEVATSSTESPPDLTASEEEVLDDMERTKKSASATFCVEIRPSNPYQKPFQVCEPQQQYGYVKPLPQQYGYVKPPKPEPVRYYQPKEQPGYQHTQPGYQHTQPGYQQSQPSYQQSQPSYQPSQPNYQPSYQPNYQPSYQPSYQPKQPQHHQVQESRPVVVLPHVPVAAPYHVPSKPSYHPPGSGGYRNSVDEAANAEDDGTARSAYYTVGGYGGEYNGGDESYGGGKVTVVDLPAGGYGKGKQLKFLKVLKDVKKDKYILYDDNYHQPQYYQAPPPHYGYDHQVQPFEHGVHRDSHGLVITCQPSAVGYTGPHSQAELSKHMDLLKNIYTQSEKVYNQQQSSGGESGGYVSPNTYRSSSGGWKEMEGRGGWKNEAEDNLMSTGGGWDKTQAEGGTRKSGGGWDKSQAEGPLRSTGGWQPTQVDETGPKTHSISVGPNPTVGMSQNEIETTAAFKNAQNQFALHQGGQRGPM